MKTEDLSFVADALLAICGEDRKAPYHSEHDFKLKLGNQRVDWFVAMANAKKPDDVLFEQECQELVARAKLTKNQAEVLDLKLNGLSFEQIGFKRGSTRQSVMNIFLQAIKKIGRVMRVYPYAGLSDVYRYELRRGASSRTFGRMSGKVAMRPSR